MRRTIVSLIVILLAVVCVGGAAVATFGGADSSSVTRARLERSLPATFSNLYVQKSRLDGRSGLTAESLHARAMCDKGGADGPDVGPGGDWICLMSWVDPEVPMPPEGYGKFELNVHSNDCYTASSPSKLTGFATLTDARGRDVTNPVFEFDGCFDPGGDDTTTDVEFPSLLSITSTALTPDPRGKVGVQITCGTGAAGCEGSIVATAGKADLGTVPFDLDEETTTTVQVPGAVPADASTVTFDVVTTSGVGPTGSADIPIQ